MTNDLNDLAPAIRHLVDAATRPLRAKVMALESQLVWQDQQMTSALAVRLIDVLTHLDAAAVGELSKEELSAALEAVAAKWNRKAKTNGKAKPKTKTNGEANGTSNGAHPA